MKEIFLTLREIYNKEKDKWNIEYALGYAYCIKMLIIGMEKTPFYNQHVKVWQLENEADENAKEFVKLTRERDHLRRENNRLKETNIELDKKNLKLIVANSDLKRQTEGQSVTNKELKMINQTLREENKVFRLNSKTDE